MLIRTIGTCARPNQQCLVLITSYFSILTQVTETHVFHALCWGSNSCESSWLGPFGPRDRRGRLNAFNPAKWRWSKDVSPAHGQRTMTKDAIFIGVDLRPFASRKMTPIKLFLKTRMHSCFWRSNIFRSLQSISTSNPLPAISHYCD